MRRPTVNAARLLAALAVALTSIAAGADAASADDLDDGSADPADPSTSTSTTTTTSSPATTTTTTTMPAPTTAPPATASPSTETTTSTTTAPATPVRPATPLAPSPPTLPPTPGTIAPAPRNVTAYPSQIANILATIRYLESRGNYTAPPNRGRASGAYQFITSTWNNYGGYRDAYLAPPEIQDERAAADVTRFLAQWNNDVSMIPVMWYFPAAARRTELMDIIPVPSAGNVLTVREYQQRWLAVWATTSGRPIPQTLGSGASGLTLGAATSRVDDETARLGFAPDVPADATGTFAPDVERLAHVAYPVLGPSRVAAPQCDEPQAVVGGVSVGAGAAPGDVEAAGLCAQAAPGIVFGVQLQPVLAVADGVITDVRNDLGDVISVTITNAVGRSFLLEGFNDDTPGNDDGAAPEHLRLTGIATVGATVRAGQTIGFLGNSSPLPLGIRADVPTHDTVVISNDAVAPHIRLTITDLDGTAVDAYGPVIDAVFRQSCTVGIGPWSGGPNGAEHEPITVETIDDDPAIDSEWAISTTGEVSASGWAAMIYPGESCGWAPPDKRGPGAGGPATTPEAWNSAIDLYTPIWVELAVRSNELTPVRMLRP